MNPKPGEVWLADLGLALDLEIDEEQDDSRGVTYYFMMDAIASPMTLEYNLKILPYSICRFLQ
jgi:hypothetical protein